MQRVLKGLLLSILLGTSLGIALIMLHVSSNGTLQNYIVEKLQEDFVKKYGCHLDCQLERIDWLSLRLYFSNVSIKPFCLDGSLEKKTWSIVADSFVLSASWWTLITRYRAKLSAVFDHAIMYESLEEETESGLMKFLGALFKQGSGGFMIYDWMSINNGLLFVENREGLSIRVPYACNVSCEKNGTRMQFYPHAGKMYMQNSLLLSGLSGSFVWDIPSQDVVKGISGQIHAEMILPALMEKGNCSLTGVMRNGLCIFSLKNEDGSFLIDPIQIRIDSKKCLFDVSVVVDANVGKQLNLHDFFQEVSGSVKVDCRGDLYDLLGTLQVDVMVDNLLYKSKKITEDVKVLIHYVKPKELSGLLTMGDKQYCKFDVVVGQNSAHVSCVTTQTIMMPGDSYWKIFAGQCSAQISYDKQQGWRGSYVIIFDNDKCQKQKKVSGSFALKDNGLELVGSLDDISYDIFLTLFPNIQLEKAKFMQGDRELAHFYIDEERGSLLVGIIDFLCLQYIVSDAFKSSFAQEGTVQFQGSLHNGVYYGNLKTTEANIRIPRIYNVIQNFSASCELDFYNRSVCLKDAKAELHEGEIVCSRANLFFDKAAVCYFMHIPCLLHNVLMSWDKGIFMLISGGMVLQKSLIDPMRLSGQIIVEKSQLKDNLFSSEFQETLFGKVLEYDDKEVSDDCCELDIAIFTKDLLHVKTSFLAARAKLDLLLKGTVKKPSLSGLIQLVSGSFYFPYKSLDITDGKLFFLPGQQFDPLLDVIAKGKLKRFGVSMHVTGSVFDPVVQFDATPYLTEEQIVSLLLLGIEENSLGVMVPALLTQKLKDLVFGPALSKNKMQTKFERLLESLKYFRFLPQFANQTGRGGLRGLFEVEASDHLHGKMDVNLMQLEDTKFEADFSVTDDIIVRAQKDGPSTYGGEVEFKWKFG